MEDTDYICLNDLLQFFPDKLLRNWERLKTTRDYIKIVEKHIGKKALLTIKGKGKEQGSYAHRWVAIEFLTWLSPEFKLLVIKEWDDWAYQISQVKTVVTHGELEARLQTMMHQLEDIFCTWDAHNDLVEDVNTGTKILMKDYVKRKAEVNERLNTIEKSIQEYAPPAEHYVYLMYNTQSKEYKIGRSETPTRRRRQLQVVEPNIELILSIPNTSQREAIVLENFLKLRFAEKLAHGEWYALDTNDLELLHILEAFARRL